MQYGHTTLRLLEKTSAHKVHLVSALDRDLAEGLGFLPADDPSRVVDRWRSEFAGETVAVLPGLPVYPKLD